MNEYIIIFIVVFAVVLIGLLINNRVNSDKYKDMSDRYDRQVRDLKRDKDYWIDAYKTMFEERDEWKKKATSDDVTDAFAAYYKLEFYEKLVTKLLGDPTKQNDDVVVMDGKTYAIRSYTLEHEPGEADTMTIECVRFSIPD